MFARSATARLLPPALARGVVVLLLAASPFLAAGVAAVATLLACASLLAGFLARLGSGLASLPALLARALLAATLALLAGSLLAALLALATLIVRHHISFAWRAPTL